MGFLTYLKFQGLDGVIFRVTFFWDTAREAASRSHMKLFQADQHSCHDVILYNIVSGWPTFLQ